MEKREEAAFLGYFVTLILVVTTGMKINVNIFDLVYLVVVLCCVLKFILIVNKNKK